MIIKDKNFTYVLGVVSSINGSRFLEVVKSRQFATSYTIYHIISDGCKFYKGKEDIETKFGQGQLGEWIDIPENDSYSLKKIKDAEEKSVDLKNMYNLKINLHNFLYEEFKKLNILDYIKIISKEEIIEVFSEWVQEHHNIDFNRVDKRQLLLFNNMIK